MLERRSPEWWFLQRAIEAAYDAGGDLEEDDRLGDYVRRLLECLGTEIEWDYGDLREMRERVRGGERLPSIEEHVLG